MQHKTGRRSFLKQIGVTGTAAIIPANVLHSESNSNKETSAEETNDIKSKRGYNSEYQNEYLSRVAFPMGGIGAGMICMEGTGALSHVSIKNRPDIFNEPPIFAAIVVKGKTNGAKILEGPVPDWKKFGRRDAGNGASGSTTGLPRFRNASFLARFPFGYLDISDNDLPLKIKITGWSPFIPTDDDNSSLPVAALEYHFVNTSAETIDAVFSFNSKNFVEVNNGKNSISSTTNGFVLTEEGTKEKPLRTDIAFFTDADAVVNHCWFRGGWWDPLTMAWNAVKNAEIKSVVPVESKAPGASLYVPMKLAAGKERTIRVMMAWYTPDTDQVHGNIGKPKENCDLASGCCNSPSDISLDKYDNNFNEKYFKPWYSSRFKNINELITYWAEQYDELRKKSLLFKNAFYKSTLPP
ncbi:MAG TPA: GH116 family glycosyl-hydrolase, partial [Chitinophagaceae bacterium]|nr:GH116 family glycosyl-hydrolase [Chitinophagaceae bacterium]